jgi:beta-lactamase class A
MNKVDLIQQAVEHCSSQLSGKLGVGFQDIQTGQKFFLNGNEQFPTASVFKIFVLAELFRQIDAGIVTLDARYGLEDTYKSVGSGVAQFMTSGTSLTVYDYALLMMAISDNTCADFLYRFVGGTNIKNHVVDAMELTQTKADLTCADLFVNYCGVSPDAAPAVKNDRYYHGDYRNSEWYACKTEKNDVTSPEDITKMLWSIYCGKWSSERACHDMLEIMKKCQTNSRIPKYLPAGIHVAHKTGTFDRVSNDVGIVYTGQGTYILSLLYNGNLADQAEYEGKNSRGYYGDEVLAKLSRRIYDIYMMSE